jgi:hypothetical protein
MVSEFGLQCRRCAPMHSSHPPSRRAMAPLRRDGGRLDATAWSAAVSWDACAIFQFANKTNGFEHISNGTTPNPLFI